MADTSTEPSLWSFVGPASQIGAGLYASLAGSGQAAGGYNNAYGTAETGINTSAAALSPFQAGGGAALGAYENLLGLGGRAPNFAAFMNSPGYQFQQQQGDQAIQRAALAQGNGFSTTTLAGLANYNSGLASTQYNNYLAQLYGLSQLGVNAATARGSQALTGAGMAGNAQVGSGVARAAGTAGVGDAIGSGLAKLPWQQIGNYFSGSGGPDTQSLYNQDDSYLNNTDFSGINPSSVVNFGDDSNP
jgi:hypothetical protein